MKDMKKYIKPELYFESFELSQQVAACDYDSNNTYNDDAARKCFFTGTGPLFGSVTVFLSHCGQNNHPSVDVTNVGYCYHNSTTESMAVGIFNS